jgi:hypothetical protein
MRPAQLCRPFANHLTYSLADHVHHLDTLNRSHGRIEGAKPLTSSHPPFDRSVITLDATAFVFASIGLQRCIRRSKRSECFRIIREMTSAVSSTHSRSSGHDHENCAVPGRLDNFQRARRFIFRKGNCGSVPLRTSEPASCRVGVYVDQPAQSVQARHI